MQHVQVGKNNAGAQGLCTALRRLMVSFGVPVEISSDGELEFIAEETSTFFKRWGIRHRRSSVSFPSSNGRAELAVKTAKTLIMVRPIQDSLPYINKDIMCFNNPQIHPQWRDAWKLKEEAPKERYVKTLETLSEHAFPLAPLRHVDHVFIQNQRGWYPKKWDSA